MSKFSGSHGETPSHSLDIDQVVQDIEEEKEQVEEERSVSQMVSDTDSNESDGNQEDDTSD